MIKKINIKAPAKINLGLRILSKRSDGFHNLHTLFYPIHDLYDELIIERSNNFNFTSNISVTESESENLVVRAKEKMEEAAGKKLNTKIYLRKYIPAGAGLGGGSSDAAAVIAALNDMFDLNFSYKKLLEIALTLGSDVPFFIRPKPAIAKSRGEILEFIDFELDKYILIINPGIHISTKEAFQNIVPVNEEINYNKIELGTIGDYANLLKNDFEDYIFETYPEIKQIKETLYSTGAEFASMSGTGSTVYGLFSNDEEAEKAAEIFPGKYFKFISIPEIQ